MKVEIQLNLKVFLLHTEMLIISRESVILNDWGSEVAAAFFVYIKFDFYKW